mgnify:FL=1
MIEKAELKKKILGCWMGKNIGGTFGTPTEGKNCSEFEKYIEYYTEDIKNGALANDDLDLQLVWLNAIEKYGNQLNSRILAEYWLSYIIPNPSEYGAAKGNLMMGIEPPISGEVNNLHKNSCGAFIRSEIWACLAPGHPEIAVRYAIMDAEVDHSGEGVYGEMFCAAMESAAFVINDRERLIDIALSYIPDESGIKRAVESVKKSYKSGLTWKQAFYELMRVEPSSFSGMKGWIDDNGKKIKTREIGYDVTGNIGIFVLGWFYGDGDFGKSLAIAVNCGEDTDCTAATLGAIYGIMNGVDRIPEKWKNPIGNDIVTCCVNDMDWTITIPKTIDELTERIMRLIPSVIGYEYCVDGFENAANLYYTGEKNKYTRMIDSDKKRNPYVVHYKSELFEVLLDYCGSIFFDDCSVKKFKLKFLSNRGTQFWVNIKAYHSDYVEIKPGDVFSTYLYQFYHGMSELEFEVNIGESNQNKISMVLELSIEGRCQKLFIPITLIKSTGIYIKNIECEE